MDIGQSHMKALATISLLAAMAIGSVATAETVCVNRRCFNCDGPAICRGSSCTCNGVAVPKASYFPDPRPAPKKKAEPKKSEPKKQETPKQENN